MKRLKRNEIVEKTIGPAVEFIKRIKANDKVVVVHDDDCDGVCSGAVVGLIIKKLLAYQSIETILLLRPYFMT